MLLKQLGHWSKIWYEYYPENEDYIKLSNGRKVIDIYKENPIK